MRRFLLAAIALGLVASTAFASPANPVAGVEYMMLAAPQPVRQAGKKVEVIEFFMYHCPFCNAFETTLEQWVKKQGDRINFRRIHMPYTGPNDAEAHLHLTLEAMGKAEEMQPKVFKAVHVDRVRLRDEAAIVDWVSKNGIDRDRFLAVWNSFGVITRLHRAPQVIDDYRMKFVPAVVIDGKYLTAPSTVAESLHMEDPTSAFPATTQVMDALVAKAAAGK